MTTDIYFILENVVVLTRIKSALSHLVIILWGCEEIMKKPIRIAGSEL
jgi:hypothetical protein